MEIFVQLMDRTEGQARVERPVARVVGKLRNGV